MYQINSGRVIAKDYKDLCYLGRARLKHDKFNMGACEADAMAYFLVDSLNNGNFEKYFKKYMEK